MKRDASAGQTWFELHETGASELKTVFRWGHRIIV